MEFVIDTSAILAVIADEPEKTALVSLTRGATLVAPPSVHWEVGNALSAMFKRARLTGSQAHRLLDFYGEIPIRFVSVDLKHAVELSADLGIYAYDAYVIACAMNQRSPILTLDRGLAAQARTLKIEVPEVLSP